MAVSVDVCGLSTPTMRDSERFREIQISVERFRKVWIGLGEMQIGLERFSKIHRVSERFRDDQRDV